MTDWQPIETAPKDRDAIGQLGICVATPDGSRWTFNHAWWDDAVEEWTDIRSDWYLNPILWQPLPEPCDSDTRPKDGDAKQGSTRE